MSLACSDPLTPFKSTKHMANDDTHTPPLLFAIYNGWSLRTVGKMDFKDFNMVR